MFISSTFFIIFLDSFTPATSVGRRRGPARRPSQSGAKGSSTGRADRRTAAGLHENVSKHRQRYNQASSFILLGPTRLFDANPAPTIRIKLQKARY
jgi:hypothetical protein